MTEVKKATTATKVTAQEVVIAVMHQVQGLAKRDKNTAQGFNFRGIDAVMNAVGPALREIGGFIVPTVDSADYTTTPTKNGGVAHIARLAVTFAVHGNTGDPILGSVVAEAFDNGDKATAKAMSVAYRTFLLQLLCLPTDEPDPDTFSYESAPAQPAITQEQLNAIWDLIEGATSKDELRVIWSQNANVLDRSVTTPMGEQTLRALILKRQAEVD